MVHRIALAALLSLPALALAAQAALATPVRP
jgi:hypothetical protein